MRKTLVSVALILPAFALMNAAPALATGAKRTFVSAVGDDAHVSTQCPLSAPCRTFGAAYSVTMPDGEIDVLDPASYGTLTISQGLSIQGHGWAAITAQSGSAITIGAGPNDKINLQGMLIDGAGAGDVGITFNSGGSLNIQDCLIRNFASKGMGFFPNGSSNLAMSNTVVADNVYDAIDITPTGSGTVTGVLDRVEIENSGNNALTASTSPGAGAIKVTVTDSVMAHNNAGIFALSRGPAIAVMVRNSTVVNNTYGLYSSATGAHLRVTRSTITGNDTGLVADSGGTLASYGDNNIDANTTNGSPTSILGYN
jgi:hypothetical protein